MITDSRISVCPTSTAHIFNNNRNFKERAPLRNLIHEVRLYVRLSNITLIERAGYFLITSLLCTSLSASVDREKIEPLVSIGLHDSEIVYLTRRTALLSSPPNPFPPCSSFHDNNAFPLSHRERASDFIIIIEVITRRGGHEREINRQSASATLFAIGFRAKRRSAQNNNAFRVEIIVLPYYIPSILYFARDDAWLTWNRQKEQRLDFEFGAKYIWILNILLASEEVMHGYLFLLYPCTKI